VMVVEKEDREGHLHLSRKQARITRAWEKIVEVHKTGRSGDRLPLRAKRKAVLSWMYSVWRLSYLGSQIDVKPVTDYDQFVWQTMEFKVVKINEAIKNAVVSHKGPYLRAISKHNVRRSSASWRKDSIGRYYQEYHGFRRLYGPWWSGRSAVYHRYQLGTLSAIRAKC